MSTIDEIKARLDILDIVSDTVELRRSGKNYTGLCPFHANTKTPAFVVWPETGTWKCFGECNEGGDIFKFVMKKEGLDFPEALRVLAERAGVELQPYTPEQQEKTEENERLRQLLEEAVTFYRHHLSNTEAGKKAYNYVKNRGLSDATIEAFGIGYAPNAWDACLKHFTEKGYSQQDLIAVGLLTERDSGRVYDRFRDRVILPIRDERGQVAGFGARTLDPEGQPKYLNSPQTDLFDKGRILFGLDKARRAIRAKDQVVIVEGYMGTLAPHQAGFDNVVATMGTALTEHHLRLIKRFTRRIVLAMDSDAAGVKATLRGLEVARQTLEREDEITFDARGLLRQEGRLQADIRVTTLPPGMDPDDVINRDPAEWAALIENANPVVVHVMQTLAADKDLDDPKVKTDIAAQVMPLIQDLPNAIERDTYRQRLARLLKVDERSLMGVSGPAAARRRPPQRPAAPQPSAADLPLSRKKLDLGAAAYKREVHILGILIRNPDLIYRMDRNLKEDDLPKLSNSDFQNTYHQQLFDLVQNSLDQNDIEPIDHVLNHLPDPLMNPTDLILAETEAYEFTGDAVLDDLMRVLLLLRKQHISQQLDVIRYLQEAAQEQGDLITDEYQDTMFRYATLQSRVHQASNRYTHHALKK